MEEKLKTLQEWVDKSRRIVAFVGAGCSTESGIPDFRSVDGLYHLKYDDPPERILSHSYFWEHTEEFYQFYRDKMLYPQARPNAAHRKLARLEEAGKLTAVVTQNIDGLQQMAGSRQVYELHGSVHRNYCTKCRKFYGEEYIRKSSGIPRCTCGGIIKPDVVLYEEGLDQNTVRDAIAAIRDADLLLVGGTSLVVYPAAGFLGYYRGDRMALINLQPTSSDGLADLIIPGRIGEVLDAIRV